MADDRVTGIYGDQIIDYSVGADNFKTAETGTQRKKWMSLIFTNDPNGEMKWMFPIEGKIFEYPEPMEVKKLKLKLCEEEIQEKPPPILVT